MTRFHSCVLTTLVASAAMCAAGPALAENDSPFSFFNRTFKGSDSGSAASSGSAQATQQESPGDLSVRIDRLEAQIRQMTGMIEQLQYRNQQLEAQISRMQGGGAQPPVTQAPPPLIRQQSGTALPPLGVPGSGTSAQTALPPLGAGSGMRRSDAFDPAANPNAPGAPRTLGTLGANAAPGSAVPPDSDPQIGAPGGRQYGTPLDLTTLGANASAANPPGSAVPEANVTQPGALPPPPARNPNATGAVASVLPPSATPRDQFDLGYGYVLRKDYALAEDALQTFLSKYPTDKMVPEAQFWLGESRFQRQRYDAAAEAFLQVSTKHPSSAKAPDAMLRLGQSLAALGQRDMACATLAEVGRKFPRASSTVKHGVDREQKRVKC